MDSAYASGRSSALSTTTESNDYDIINKEENIVSQTEELETFPEEQEDEEGAMITEGPVDVTALIGQSATLTAQYRGNPSPVITWLKKVMCYS